MSLKDWKELPLLVKRNPKKFFDYLAEELELETSWDDLTVIERRSRHKQYQIIRETITSLPAWNELSPFERRNLKKLYKKIKSVAETPSTEPVEKIKYYFNSYDDNQGTTLWGTGSVETTGIIEGDYTEVEVLTNSTDQSFVGRKFYISSDAKTDGTLYPLYSDAGETAVGIYVSISTNAPTYNVTVSVKDSNETAIQGAIVTLTDSIDNTKTYTGTSGSAGGCTIKPTAGTYIVTATCEGYENYTADENLVVSEAGSLTVVLTAATTEQEQQ